MAPPTSYVASSCRFLRSRLITSPSQYMVSRPSAPTLLGSPLTRLFCRQDSTATSLDLPRTRALSRLQSTPAGVRRAAPLASRPRAQNDLFTPTTIPRTSSGAETTIDQGIIATGDSLTERRTISVRSPLSSRFRNRIERFLLQLNRLLSSQPRSPAVFPAPSLRA